MTVQFDDLLSTLCTQFEPQHANDFQKIYLIPDAKEAKLVFDVLVAYGFDGKVYHDAEKGSKLYVTPPPTSDVAIEQKFAQALAYARSLSDIKASLDTLAEDPALASPDYNITFANAPGNNKQINIVLTQAVAAVAQTSAAPRPARPAIAKGAMVKKKMSRKEEENHLSSGPTLGKRYYPGKLDEKAKSDQNSLKRQIFLYLTGNAATGGTVVMFVVIAAALTFTFFVLAKSFLCPDFAVAKQNTAWYCEQGKE